MKVLVLRDGCPFTRETIFPTAEFASSTACDATCLPLGYDPSPASDYIRVRMVNIQRAFADWFLCSVALEINSYLAGRWAPALIFAGKTDQPVGLVTFAHAWDEFGRDMSAPRPGDWHTFGVLFLPS